MAPERRISSLSKNSAASRTEVRQKAKGNKVMSDIKCAIAWTAYVLIGSWLFLILEVENTEVRVENEHWTRFKELVTFGEVVEELYDLKKHLAILCPHSIFDHTVDDLNNSSLVKNANKTDTYSSSNDTLKALFSEVELVCSESFVVVQQITYHPELNMMDAIYYTMTLVTTIGFGHIYPSTPVGRLFSIPYALVGVPLTCILMAKTSDILSNRMLVFYETTRKRYTKHPRILLWIVTWLFLLVGCFVFMFLPSLVFAIFENWTYIDSFYFTFITLSTIGFGDLIAGYGGDMYDEYKNWYRFMIVVWIMIALGYWIFLLNFLQKAIKSNAKTLQRTFRTKTISKQAEFLKHLIAKVSQPDETTEDVDYEKRLHMMALIVESLNESTPNLKASKSFNSIYSNKTGVSRASYSRSAKQSENTVQDRLQLMTKMVEAVSRKPSRIFDSNTVMSEPQLAFSDTEESFHDIIEEDWQQTQTRHAITFSELMKVKISIKTDMLPGFETLVEQAGSKGWVLDAEEEGVRVESTSSSSKSITLPMKDILSVVLLVASFDEDLQQILTRSDDDTTSETSVSPVCPKADPRESVPLIKKILAQPQVKISKEQNHQEKENLQNTYPKSTVFNSYLNDCSAHMSQSITTTKDDDRFINGEKSYIV